MMPNFYKTAYCLQFMKNIPQRTLEYNVGLVRYENPKQKDAFDLTTVHSLLVDQNPKFIQLRQLIVDYNSKQVRREVKRPHLQRPFVERLFKMLCQLTRINHTENQLQFLNKIYSWAFNQKSQNENFNLSPQANDKVRPATASTKTRPYSAYTKGRPDSGVPTKQTIHSKAAIQMGAVSKKMIEQHPEVDFTSLKHGERQFFLGHRTLHPEQEKPRIRLKQYQRKVFYDEPDEEERFKEFVEEKREFIPKPKIPEIPVVEQIELVEQPKEGVQNLQADGVEGTEGQDLGNEGALAGGEEEANIDDLVGIDQEQVAGEQEEPEQLDKLKPRVKVYGNSLKPIPKQNLEEFNRGLKRQEQEKNALARKVEEDKTMVEMMQVWAAAKNRVKIEQRRRAQSARMMTKNTGIPFEKYVEKHDIASDFAQVIDLSQQRVPEIKVNTRPVSAFQAQSLRVHNQIISDALVTGNLRNHIGQQLNQNQPADTNERFCTFAAKPKKKTFEEILKQAQQRVNKETLNEIEEVKQKLSNNKVALGGNKIFKSLSHHEPEVLQGEFVGQIIGQGMIKNPFFKVAKKKKKKKKK